MPHLMKMGFDTPLFSQDGILRSNILGVLLVAALMVFPTDTWCQQGTASFGGIVVTDAGVPVSGTTVFFNNVRTCTVPVKGGGITCTPGVSGTASTDADG